MSKFKILIKQEGEIPKTYIDVDAQDIRDAESQVREMYKESRFDLYYSYYGGDGLPRKDKKDSEYRVKYGDDEIATFTNRKDAIKFYKQRKVDKSFWDGTELMDCMIWQSIGESDN